MVYLEIDFTCHLMKSIPHALSLYHHNTPPQTPTSSAAVELIHLSHHLVDEVFPVSVITTLHEVVCLHPHSTCRTTQLEGPQEVVRLLEILTYCENLVDQILNTDDPTGSQYLFNNFIVTDGNALVVHLCKSSLVDQLSDGLQVGVTPSYERLHQTQHVQGAFVEFHESSVVDLSKTKKL